MSSQRPFFLSTFFAAFRQQPPSLSSTAQPSSHTHKTTTTTSRTITTTTPASASSSQPQPTPSSSRTNGVINSLPLSPRAHHAIPIPQGRSAARRRGSNSSTEGFRDALGTEKLYIGGRTATGEEKFFKLGVVRRVRSGDRLSLDRLSL